MQRLCPSVTGGSLEARGGGASPELEAGTP